LEKKRLRVDLTASYSFLRRGSGEGGVDLFSLISSAWEWFKAASEDVQA